MRIIFAATILFITSLSVFGQKKKEPVDRILFIFDASQSMLGKWQSGSITDIKEIARHQIFNQSAS